MSEAEPTRCGFVAVIGAPNAGKSTLVNTLVGSKVSIVTPKVQTTRMRVKGVAILGRTQIVFMDTPGIFRPRRLLDRAMVRSAWNGVREAEAVLFLVDAAAAAREKARNLVDARALTDELRRAGHKAVALVLNKVDAIAHDRLLPLTDVFNDPQVFRRVFMISALKGDGLGELKTWCQGHMPEGPWLYPPEQAADIPSRLLAAEITREKLYMRVHEELPYATTVETESWNELKDGSIRIEQTVYVTRESQKAIVLGAKGAMIKSIGAAARSELERLLDKRVHLFVFVKVRERWAEERERLSALGLEVPDA